MCSKFKSTWPEREGSKHDVDGGPDILPAVFDLGEFVASQNLWLMRKKVLSLI